MHQRGFTIVELLICVAVIAILTTIGGTAYSNGVAMTRTNVAQSEMKSLIRAIQSTTAATGKRMGEITAPLAPTSSWTSKPCAYEADIRSLPKTHACWTNYIAALDAITAAGVVNVDQYKKGDPWGSPYLIDENEGEAVGAQCLRSDTIGSAGPNGRWSNSAGGAAAADAQRDNILYAIPRIKATADC